MARKQLADLVVEEAERDERIPEPIVEAPPAPNVEAATPPLKAVAEAMAEEGGPTLPKYLRLVRKEARLREDQVLDLDRLVLRLNRAKPQGAGERITLNTLLRLGADLLLERQGELAGNSEEELAASLRNSQTL